MQENNYFNRNSYLTLIQRAHNNMVGKGSEEQKGSKDLQLKIDHFFHSQSQKMFQGQLKYVCLAVRAEDTLREHLTFQSERKRMRAVIQRSQAFNKGFKDCISAKDTELNQQDEEAKQAVAKETHQIKRVG